jgi:hypothetical protein
MTMKSLTDSDAGRLFRIPAKITDDELDDLLEAEGEEREEYFRSLEEKYCKLDTPGSKEQP